MAENPAVILAPGSKVEVNYEQFYEIEQGI